MSSYSIQFITKPKKGKQRTWLLSRCSDMDKIQQRLRRIRQLVNAITGSRSELLTELTDWRHITQSCNPTWTRSITIPDPRAYTFYISSQDKAAVITAKAQGEEIHHIGLKEASDMESYQNVISFMLILIRLLEGNNSPNIDWVEDMSVGKVNPHQDWYNDTKIHNLLDLFIQLQKPQARSTLISNPSEINIAVPPSSYEVIITKH